MPSTTQCTHHTHLHYRKTSTQHKLSPDQIMRTRSIAPQSLIYRRSLTPSAMIAASRCLPKPNAQRHERQDQQQQPVQSFNAAAPRPSGIPSIPHASKHTPHAAAEQHHVNAASTPHASKHAQFEELDAALAGSSGGRFHLLLLSCICCCWAGDAAEVMVLSYLSPAASCSFGLDSPTSQSLLSAAVFGGMLIGAASWGFLADEVGRKRALLASTLTVLAAGLASSAAPTPALLLLSRAFVGFGLAGAPVAFTLLMEMLPPASRAVWGVGIELAWTVGTIAEAALAWAVLNTQGWRLLLLLSTGPLVLLLVLLRWLPESPRYLLANGDAAGAAAVLQQIARINGRPPLQLQHLVNPDQQVTTAAASSFTSSSSAAAATLLVTAAAPAVLEEQQQRRRRHSHLPPLEVSSPPTSPDSEREGLLSPNTSSSTSPSPTDTTTSDQQQQHGPSTSDFPHTRPQHKSSAAFDSSQPGSLKVLAAEVQQALGTLWGGAYASSTTLLLLSWLCVACAYYGLVQLDGQLHIQAAGAAAGGAAAGGAGGTALACADGKLQVPGSDYAAVMLTAAAEVPAVAWAAAASKSAGAKNALVASLALGCVCLLPPIVDSLLHVSGSAQAASGGIATDNSWSSTVTEASMFGSRLFVSAAFSLLWVFTPAHFLTRVRGAGLGISNACGRLGGLLSPFIAINLTVAASPAASEGLLAVLCGAAAGAVCLISHSEQQLEEIEGDT